MPDRSRRRGRRDQAHLRLSACCRRSDNSANPNHPGCARSRDDRQRCPSIAVAAERRRPVLVGSCPAPSNLASGCSAADLWSAAVFVMPVPPNGTLSFAGINPVSGVFAGRGSASDKYRTSSVIFPLANGLTIGSIVYRPDRTSKTPRRQPSERTAFYGRQISTAPERPRHRKNGPAIQIPDGRTEEIRRSGLEPT